MRINGKASKTHFIGFIAPFIALVSIFTSISLSPNFNWAGNALSDLGHWTRTDIGPNPLIRALIFNIGLVTTGSILTVITLVTMKEVDDKPTILALIPFLLSTAFLALSGVFSEDTWIHIGGESLHYFASFGFFFTFPISMWFIGTSWLRFPHLKWFSAVSLFLPFSSVYLWWGTFRGIFPWKGVAIPELLTSLTVIAWFWLFLGLKEKGMFNTLILKQHNQINQYRRSRIYHTNALRACIKNTPMLFKFIQKHFIIPTSNSEIW